MQITYEMPPMFLDLASSTQPIQRAADESELLPLSPEQELDVYRSCRPCVRCQRRTGCWCDHCEEEFEELNDNGELMSGRAICNACEAQYGCCESCASEERPRLKPRCSVCNKHSTLRCGHCKAANYCSRQCHVRAWSWHRTTCRPANQSTASQEANEPLSRPKS